MRILKYIFLGWAKKWTVENKMERMRLLQLIIQVRKYKEKRKTATRFYVWLTIFEKKKSKEVLRIFGFEGKLQLQKMSFIWQSQRLRDPGGKAIQQAVRKAKRNIRIWDVAVGVIHIKVNVEVRRQREIPREEELMGYKTKNINYWRK